MRSKHLPLKSASRRRHKPNLAVDARWKKGIQLEIARLNAILHDPLTTPQQKTVAQLQIAECQESANIAVAPSSDWLRQMDLLAE
jgi:hypothetical protein